MEEEAETEEEETTDSEGERCVRCGGDNFRAKKVSKAWGGIYGGKERVLECVNCGTVVR